MNTKKLTYPQNLRFSSKEQKHEAKKLAQKNSNSLNGYILSLIDADRAYHAAYLKKSAKLEAQ